MKPKLSMKLSTNWEDKKHLIPFLATQLKMSRLSLVVGSGISTNFGLPAWDDLLDSIKGDFKTPSDYPKRTSAQKATLIKSKVFGNDNDLFLKAVRKSLYENAEIDFEDLQKNHLLSSLGALIMASSRGSISNVITFNYDDIIETYLGYFGYTCESSADGISWSSNKDVVVHHPHGLMPHEDSFPTKGEIVLDTSSFHAVMKEGSHWRKKMFQILSSSLVIFIGVSGEDQHLESHLEECKNLHVSSINNELCYWGIWFTTDDESAIAEIWRQQKVFPFKIESYDEIPSILFKICQESSKLL
jgi:hypothetical protein